MWRTSAAVKRPARSGQKEHEDKGSEVEQSRQASVRPSSVSVPSPTRILAASSHHQSSAPATAVGQAQGESESVGIESSSSSSSSSDDTLVYSGAGLRVLSAVEDSTISFASSFDLDLDDGNELDRASSTSDDSDQLTALASRPSAIPDRKGQESEPSHHSPSDIDVDSHPSDHLGASDSSSSGGFDDLSTTPGLSTAAMSGMYFNHALEHSSPGLHTSNSHTYNSRHSSPRPRSSNRQPSAPHSPGVVHMTLASYLSSNLSSPKTRSLSSGSLASFPTDLLSDISRADSVVDLTDDAASEFNTSESGNDGAAGGESRYLDRRRHQNRPQRRTGEEGSNGVLGQQVDMTASSISQINGSELVMPTLSGPPSEVQDSSPSQSGSDKQSISPPRRRSRKLDKSKTPPAGAAAFADANQSPCFLIVGGSTRQQAILRASLDSFASDVATGKGVETASSLLCAYERVEQPFAALNKILRPESDQSANNELLQNLLPSLLSQVAAISICFLILDATDGRSLAQHVSDQFAQIRMISEYAGLVPVIFDPDGDSHGADCASQLTQGNIDWLGRDKHGRLGSLKSRARPFRMEYLSDLPATLAASNLHSTPVKAFLRYNTLHSSPTARVGGSQPTSARGVSAQSTKTSQPPRTEISPPASLASSMLEDVSVPPSSQSGISATSHLPHADSTLVQRSIRNHACFSHALDPLHLPSIMRLMGLNLAASFQTLSGALRGVFSESGVEHQVAADERLIRELLAEDDKLKASRNPIKSIPVQPFFGCARWRYAGNHGQYHRHEKSAPRRCCGIFVAGIIVGVALWFS